jgi:hypothetical protein
LTTQQSIQPVSLNISGNVASFTFSGYPLGLPDGNYHAALNGGAAFDFSVLLGDANHDGRVDSLDFTALAQNFNKGTGVSWSKGDFNFDGVVNALDFDALATRYGASASPMPGSSLSQAQSPTSALSLRSAIRCCAYGPNSEIPCLCMETRWYVMNTYERAIGASRGGTWTAGS